MRRRLAIIDLDGTLLGPTKRVSAENLRALERLREAGFETVFCSGRHHRNLVRFEAEVGPMGWVISTSGAVIRHASTGDVLHELTLAESDALELCASARKAGLSLIAYHREGVFIEEESDWTRLYARRAEWDPARGDFGALAGSGMQKVLVSESGERMKLAGVELEQAFRERLYVVWTEEELVEFHAPQVNKAVGAEALARALGIAQSEVVAFGDGNNDVEVLAWAGYSVAMAHGHATARAAAKAVSSAGAPETAFARAVEAVLALG